jgi:hypothetical protein
MSPSRSARSQAFEGRGLFYFEEIEASLVFFQSDLELMAQSQSSHDFVVLLDVCLLQVVEQLSALLDHFQQSAPRMIVLFVSLEMFGEFANPLT